jgi:hypothetical protein
MSMSARRLSLHPSALSDAEHALFTASLADLADVDSTSNDNIVMDWNRISVRVREARAWLCGRYASLGTGTIDEVRFLSLCFLCFCITGREYRSSASSPRPRSAAARSLLCCG